MFRNRIIMSGIIFLGFCIAAPQLVHAQEGSTISEIRVEGLTTMSRAQFLGKIKLKKGDIFRRDVLADDIKRLAENGIIVTVESQPGAEPGTTVITFRTLSEKAVPVVTEVEYNGGSRSALEDVTHVKRGTNLVEYILSADERRIRQYYSDKGYPDATVESQVKILSPGQVKVIFNIEKGPKYQLVDLTFTGNDEISSSQLRAIMDTKVDGWFTSKIFVKSVFENDITKLNLFYQSRGYFDAQVSVEELAANPETGEVHAVIHVDEGPRYKIGELHFEGNQAISTTTLLSLVELRPGAEFSEPALRRDTQTIEKYYTTGDRGYASINVQPEFALSDQPERVNVTYHIREGKPTYIRRIETRGNYKTKKKVIIREMRIEPGDLYNSRLIENSIRRINDLQYFDPRSITITMRQAPPPKIGAVEGADYVDLIVQVEETETGRIVLGAGFNTNSALVGQFVVEQRNFDISNLPDFKRYGLGALSPSRAFIGGGQTLRLSATPGSEYNNYNFEFIEPWLFDYPVQFTLKGYYFERFFTGYTIGRLGGTIGIGRRFGRRWSASIRYRREQVDVRDLDEDSPAAAVDQAGTHDLGIFRAEMNYDGTDSIIFPTRGVRLGTFAEIAGGPAGGNVNFWKYGIEGSSYFHLWDFPKETPNILSLRAETRFAGPTAGDEQVPIYERFFAGGLNSIRGFEFRGIGPRQIGGAEAALGGDFLFLGTAEYIIPLYNENYQGYIFTDVGTLTDNVSLNAFDVLRVSAGAGVRLNLPVMGRIPLTINFGVPLKKQPQDQTQFFSFALGLFF